MRKYKSSVSKATCYLEIGEFWDTHDLSDFWDRTKDTYFDVEIKPETTYYAGDKKETNNKSEGKPWK